MLESGERETFLMYGTSITGQQLEALARDWPERFKPWYLERIDHGKRRMRASKLQYLEPPFADQEACFDMRYDDYYSQFCQCVRWPDQCYNGPGGGGNGDNGNDDTSDCLDVTSDDVYMVGKTYITHALSDYHDEVQFTAYTDTMLDLLNVEDGCVDELILTTTVYAAGSFYRYAFNGDRLHVRTISDNKTSGTAVFLSVSNSGYVSRSGTSAIEQEGTHSGNADLKGGSTFTETGRISQAFESW